MLDTLLKIFLLPVAILAILVALVFVFFVLLYDYFTQA